ncbi:hypothetical protein OTU49_006132, partial [Cherax quadricarinatus]
MAVANVTINPVAPHYTVGLQADYQEYQVRVKTGVFMLEGQVSVSPWHRSSLALELHHISQGVKEGSRRAKKDLWAPVVYVADLTCAQVGTLQHLYVLIIPLAPLGVTARGFTFLDLDRDFAVVVSEVVPRAPA